MQHRHCGELAPHLPRIRQSFQVQMPVMLRTVKHSDRRAVTRTDHEIIAKSRTVGTVSHFGKSTNTQRATCQIDDRKQTEWWLLLRPGVFCWQCRLLPPPVRPGGQRHQIYAWGGCDSFVGFFFFSSSTLVALIGEGGHSEFGIVIFRSYFLFMFVFGITNLLGFLFRYLNLVVYHNFVCSISKIKYFSDFIYTIFHG